MSAVAEVRSRTAPSFTRNDSGDFVISRRGYVDWARHAISFLGWIASGMVLYANLDRFRSALDSMVPGWGFNAVVAIFFGVPILLARDFVWELLGTETIEVNEKDLTATVQVWKWTRTKTYRSGYVRGIEWRPKKWTERGSTSAIAAYYGPKLLRFFKGIEERDAKPIIASISPILGNGLEEAK
ncbi:MAG: hypothetical protein KDJ19_05820 [Hyphomicrobiaceae bacterium]|nr:hypothetical protein [Hyphomicrobiaceae bacterium]